MEVLLEVQGERQVLLEVRLERQVRLEVRWERQVRLEWFEVRLVTRKFQVEGEVEGEGAEEVQGEVLG